MFYQFPLSNKLCALDHQEQKTCLRRNSRLGSFSKLELIALEKRTALADRENKAVGSSLLFPLLRRSITISGKMSEELLRQMKAKNTIQLRRKSFLWPLYQSKSRKFCARLWAAGYDERLNQWRTKKDAAGMGSAHQRNEKIKVT